MTVGTKQFIEDRLYEDVLVSYLLTHLHLKRL